MAWRRLWESRTVRRSRGGSSNGIQAPAATPTAGAAFDPVAPATTVNTATATTRVQAADRAVNIGGAQPAAATSSASWYTGGSVSISTTASATSEATASQIMPASPLRRRRTWAHT